MNFLSATFLSILLLIGFDVTQQRRPDPTNCTGNRYMIDLLQISNASHYKRHLSPKIGVKVSIRADVLKIGQIDDMKSSFEIDFMMHEIWEDKRLSFEGFNPCGKHLSLPTDVYEQLWNPNTCFMNTKSAVVHESPFKNLLVLLFKNGTVWSMYRATVVGPCIMYLGRFPMDKRTCHLTFESFSYSIQEIRMTWGPNPIDLPKEQRRLADYYVTNYQWNQHVEPYPAGDWEELTMSFTMERRYGWYILNVYVPTYVIVFFSWISFALGSKAIPARAMLGVNSLLAMTFQFAQVISNLPKVDYVKAIDVWMFTLMTFIFCSLVELAIVGYLSWQDDKRMGREGRADLAASARSSSASLRDDEGLQSVTDRLARTHPGNTDFRVGSTKRVRYKGGERKTVTEWTMLVTCGCGQFLDNLSEGRIDNVSSVLFPSLFALFNIVYWGCYLPGAGSL